MASETLHAQGYYQTCLAQASCLVYSDSSKLDPHQPNSICSIGRSTSPCRAPCHHNIHLGINIQTNPQHRQCSHSHPPTATAAHTMPGPSEEYAGGLCTLTDSESLEQDDDDSEEVAIEQGGGRKRKHVQTAEPGLPAAFQAAWDVWDGVPVHIPPSCVTIVLPHHPCVASLPVEQGIPEVKLDPVPVHFDVAPHQSVVWAA